MKITIALKTSNRNGRPRLAAPQFSKAANVGEKTIPRPAEVILATASKG